MSEENAGFIAKLRKKINKGDSWLTYDLGRLFTDEKLNDDAIEVIEERLLIADAGVEATMQLTTARCATK